MLFSWGSHFMRVLIVYTHPHSQSFNHAILNVCKEEFAQKGHDVRVKDLYAQGFQPVLGSSDFEALARGVVPADIKREQEDVAWAEALVFLYPVWWFDRPALLKGWIDRVFLNGFAFSYGPQGAQGLLRHKWAAVIQTAGSDKQSYVNADAVDLIQRPMTDGTLRFCGIQAVHCMTLYAVAAGGEQAQAQKLQEVREFVKGL